MHTYLHAYRHLWYACIIASGHDRGYPLDVHICKAPVHSVCACAGTQAVRLAWGSAQEAATLYAVMSAFPDAHLSEVSIPAGSQ